MLLSDMHLHSSFSSDSDASMEQMIVRGIQLGLKTLCFTEHCDFDYPKNPEHLDFLLDFDAYYHKHLLLKEKYQSQIELLHGIELGIQPHLKEKLGKFHHAYGDRYDFIIHSCHIVDSLDPYDSIYFETFPEKEGIRKYFETIYENMSVYEEYQTVGHLDYVRRYVPSPAMPFTYGDYSDILDAILERIIKDDKALEVNSAGLKAGLQWPNPHRDILKRYHELGGSLITIGSDAHKPEHMAYAFSSVREILLQAGFSEYVVFKNKKPLFYPI